MAIAVSTRDPGVQLRLSAVDDEAVRGMLRANQHLDKSVREKMRSGPFSSRFLGALMLKNGRPDPKPKRQLHHQGVLGFGTKVAGSREVPRKGGREDTDQGCGGPGEVIYIWKADPLAENIRDDYMMQTQGLKGKAVSVESLDALRDLPDSASNARLGERRFARHTNKNGTTGGFVESTAITTPFVTIGKRSLVLEHAMVKDVARLDGEITIRGNAHVYESARLTGKMEIGGKPAGILRRQQRHPCCSTERPAETLFRGNSLGIRNCE
jgi:hypothetical protein